MGYHAHHAIVVTSWNKEAMTELAEFVKTTEAKFIGPSEECVNGYVTLTIVPDGSKEGWQESDLGDGRRNRIINWMTEHKDPWRWDWIEIRFGGDEPELAEILRYRKYEEED